MHDTDRGSLPGARERLRSLDPHKMAAGRIHERVRALLDPPQGGPVLDVGPGEGALTQWLARHGYRPVAVGIVASQYKCDEAPFVLANLDQGIPVVSGSIQGIVAIEV